jgi:hypothetical protein
MIGPRMTTIKRQIEAPSKAYKFRRPAHQKSVYIQLRPSTERYQQLMALAEQLDVSYHRLALEALDWFLATYKKR